MKHKSDEQTIAAETVYNQGHKSIIIHVTGFIEGTVRTQVLHVNIMASMLTQTMKWKIGF